MSKVLWSLGCLCLTLAFVLFSEADSPASDSPGLPRHHPSIHQAGAGDSSGRIIRVAAKKPKKKSSSKKGSTDAATSEKEAMPAENAAGGDSSELKFSRDIAPILVSNCLNCHNEKGMSKNGKFDLSSFDKLINQKAGSGDVVVVPGKPEESHLYLRLTGEETPKMPRGGNNRRLSESAIEKIGLWVKQGAKLDAGVDTKAEITSYASSPEQLKRDELSKMTVEQRDKIAEAKGLERWKKGNAKATPEVTPSKNFLLFGNVPKDRTTATLKVVEAQLSSIKSVLPIDAVQKIGVYVFNDRTSFAEFARTVENREVEASVTGTSNLADSEPYVAVVDPLGGREETAGSGSKKASRSKRSEGGGSDVERSLGGLVTEYLASGAVRREGKAPGWLSEGTGALFAAKVDARSPYVSKLRRNAYDVLEQGWVSKASDALGGDSKPEDVRAVGYAIVETVVNDPRSRPYFSKFVRAMLAGGEKLDDTLQSVLEMSREDFLAWTGEYVQAKFAPRR